MNKKIWLALIIGIIISILIFAIIYKPNNNHEQVNNSTKIVTSFYPICIMTSNIVENAPNVELVNMTDKNVGCVHNYTLATSDMRKIENADIFIKNGLNLEGFMDNIISTYPNLKIIDSSINIQNKIQEEENVNPHIWTSITNYINQVEEISNKLCEYNSENSNIYKTNTQNYINKLNNLKEKYNNNLKHLNKKKAICLNEALVYLAEEIKMEVTLVETHHEESTLSAETLKNLVDKIKSENINIILVDINDNLRNAQTLSNETGAKIYKLNSCLTGEDNINSYINNMEQNLEILEQIQ